MKRLFLIFSFIFIFGCVEHQFYLKDDRFEVAPIAEVKKYKAEKEKSKWEEVLKTHGLILKKDYADVFARSGLNIDTDSNTAVDVAYGGLNLTSAVTGLLYGNGTSYSAATMSNFPTTGTWTLGAATIDFSSATITFPGTITATTSVITPLLDAAGAEDMDYGSADVTDHTFTTDGTGDSEIVLPNDSIGNDELDWGSMTDLTTDGAVVWGNLAEGELTNSSILSADIKDDEIVNDDINASAGIVYSKLAAMTEANLYTILSDVSNFAQPSVDETITGYWTNLILRTSLATGALGSIAARDLFWTDPDNYDPASTGLSGAGNDYLDLKTDSGHVALLKSDGTLLHGAFQLPYSDSGDATLTEGYIQQKSDEDGIAYAFAGDAEIPGEVFQSLLDQISIEIDPSAAYDQNSTTRTTKLFYVGDRYPHGFTMTFWKVLYTQGDPTTELDADIMCDTTPDLNPAADATVMDVIDTTNGASTADSGFDSTTCANGSYVYIRYGADPTDANVTIAFDMEGYAEED